MTTAHASREVKRRGRRLGLKDFIGNLLWSVCVFRLPKPFGRTKAFRVAVE
jgi:hypothetical protein